MASRTRSGPTPAKLLSLTLMAFFRFEQPTTGDLLCGPHKLLGSSQRKQRHALLQHGALLLAGSPFTPSLPGLKELTGVELPVAPLIDAIVHAFQETTGQAVEPQDWKREEQAMIEHLALEKYAQAHWNEKR